MHFSHNSFYHTITFELPLHKNVEFYFEPKILDKKFKCISCSSHSCLYLHITQQRVPTVNKLISIMLTNLSLSVDPIWLFKHFKMFYLIFRTEIGPLRTTFPTSLNEWNWHVIVFNTRHIWANHFKFRFRFILNSVFLVMTLSAEC